MKKIYFILVAAAAMFFATEARAQIGVEVGYSLTDHAVKALVDEGVDMLDGFYLGVNYDMNFLENEKGAFGLQTGIRFSYSIMQEVEQLLGIVTRASLNESYLDLPVFAKYSYDLRSLTLSAFAGPVFSCGLTSESKVSINDKLVSHLNNYENDSVYGRFDLKIGLGIGATFNDRISAKVGYNIGMLNRYTGNIDSASLRTGVFYAGMGFTF